MRAAVVGGGLAGLAAALDLLDAGADVTVHEARPTLGGAVQTLPERDDDPKPPPDFPEVPTPPVQMVRSSFTNLAALANATSTVALSPICQS